MHKESLRILACGILLLFVIQSTGTLVESIYILDLLNTSLDAKALGLLFFFSPLLALPFFGRAPRRLGWLLFALLFLARGLLPTLTTSQRMLAAGIAVGAACSLFFLIFTNRAGAEAQAHLPRWGAAGLALALGLSALLRTAYAGVEYTLAPAGGWLGWGLGLALGLLLARADLLPPRPAASGAPPAGQQPGRGALVGALLGIYLVLTLVYFVFSAPAVITRWTEGSYALIVGALSLLSLAFTALALARPALLDRLPQTGLRLWNGVFTLSLAGTLLALRLPFPPTLDSPPLVVGPAGWLAQALAALLLLSFPVIFLDLRLFLRQAARAKASGGGLALGIVSGALALVLLTFIHIFTNVWGYVEPVSPLFRNAFWLPHFLPAAGLILLTWRAPAADSPQASSSQPGSTWALAALALLFLATVWFARPVAPLPVDTQDLRSLRVMTFNVQQFNAEDGEKSFERQLALVRRASPDLLFLQESDSTRISFNNNDYVRFFAEALGFYAYYGPTPVSGTFGTAILSRFPLENPRSVFLYSDKDETGIAEAEVVVGGRRFTLYNVHPDSSDPAMLRFAQVLLQRALAQPNAIAAGDYNLRDTEEAYQLIASSLTNAWVSVYPDKISPDGVDMSGRQRIDHIFFTPGLLARQPVYVLPPESATDHPVHWSEIYWESP